MVVKKEDEKDRNKPEEFVSREAGLMHTKKNKESEQQERLIQCYHDIFRSSDGKNRIIYIIGDVGTGKTSFCKMMMHNWCRAVAGKSDKRKLDMGNENLGPADDDNIRDIRAFEFLFYVPLQFMSGKSDDFAEMIKKQLPQYSTLIDKIFSDESEKCLLLADGLDEWRPQSSESLLPHETYGLPASRNVRSATIITTSRPSAIAILDMKSSECDIKVNLLGINELKTMIEKYMALLSKSSTQVNILYQKLETLNLRNLQKTPMLLQQIIWLFCNKYEIDKSITYIYTHIVNIIFKWMHKKSKERLTQNTCTSIGGLQLPKLFEKYTTCQENQDLIKILGKVAYNIFIAKEVSSVVLDRYGLKQLGLTDEDISAVLQVGILHEEQLADPTYAESQLSFIHTSLLEFFAAIYISSCCPSQTQISPSTLIEDLIRRHTSVAELLRLGNVLVMVCGLSPFLTYRIIECICQVAYRDKQMVNSRKAHYLSFIRYRSSCTYLAQQIQDTCFRCVSESKSAGEQPQLRVNLCDCVVYTREQLEMCLSSVRSVRFATISPVNHLSHEQCTSLSRVLSQVASLESLNLNDVTCTQAGCDGHSIDLSHHERLKSVQLFDCNNISVCGVTLTTNLKSCVISNCRLSHEQCTSFSLILSQAVLLESLYLKDVTCMQVGCDGLSIDLSNHEQLQSLQIERCHKINVSGITPVTKLKLCQILNCRLSHEQCTSVSSFLSQAVLLESLDIEVVSCNLVGCDGHSIDLSHHEQLQRLHLERCDDICVYGITPTTKLKSCEIRYFRLSHEQCTALSSFLSQSVSLENIDIKRVTCKQAGCDGPSIDLSHHKQLQSLQVHDCGQISVSCVTLTTDLKSCGISGCRLSHEQFTSLSLFLSQSVSLESLDLKDVTCKRTRCDGHTIDLSHHEQNQSVQLFHCDQLSVSGVTPTAIYRGVIVPQTRRFPRNTSCYGLGTEVP